MDVVHFFTEVVNAPLVLDQILLYLAFADLYALKDVNRHWDSAIRDHIQAHPSVYAKQIGFFNWSRSQPVVDSEFKVEGKEPLVELDERRLLPEVALVIERGTVVYVVFKLSPSSRTLKYIGCCTKDKTLWRGGLDFSFLDQDQIQPSSSYERLLVSLNWEHEYYSDNDFLLVWSFNRKATHRDMLNGFSLNPIGEAKVSVDLSSRNLLSLWQMPNHGVFCTSYNNQSQSLSVHKVKIKHYKEGKDVFEGVGLTIDICGDCGRVPHLRQYGKSLVILRCGCHGRYLMFDVSTGCHWTATGGTRLPVPYSHSRFLYIDIMSSRGGCLARMSETRRYNRDGDFILAFNAKRQRPVYAVHHFTTDNVTDTLVHGELHKSLIDYTINFIHCPSKRGFHTKVVGGTRHPDTARSGVFLESGDQELLIVSSWGDLGAYALTVTNLTGSRCEEHNIWLPVEPVAGLVLTTQCILAFIGTTDDNPEVKVLTFGDPISNNTDDLSTSDIK